MNKKTSIIIFEYKKSKVKPSQIFKSLRNWQRESKHKFKYHTIIDANPRNKASIIAVGIKPILPDPPRPPMMPSKYLDQIGKHTIDKINSHAWVVKFK